VTAEADSLAPLSEDFRDDPQRIVPWKSIARQSEELTARLAKHGPSEELFADATRLLADAQRSGQITPKLASRDRLYGILSYWAAAIRIFTDRDVLTPSLDQPERVPWMPILRGEEAQARATAPEGLIGYEVDDMRFEGSDEKPAKAQNLKVEGGRLIRAHWNHVQVINAMVLSGSGVYVCRLPDVRAHNLQANEILMWGSHATLHITGKLDFTGSAIRRSLFDHCIFAQEAVFFDTIFTEEPRPEIDGVIENHELTPDNPEDGSPHVVFRSCTFHTADFRLAQLAGVRFERCKFSNAVTFDRASLRNTSFDACTFGSPTSSDVVGDFSGATFGDNVTFDDRSLVNVRLPDRASVNVPLSPDAASSGAGIMASGAAAAAANIEEAAPGEAAPG
jgi:hypothetical protein